MLAHPSQHARRQTTALIRQLGLEAIGAFHKQKGLCFRCHTPWGRGAQVDHHVPVSLGGGGGIENLRVLCGPCNSQKSSRHPTADTLVHRVETEGPHPSQVRRTLVYTDQSGLCAFCPLPLIGDWPITRRGRGVCQSCTVLYRRLSEEQILRKLGLDLI